MKLYSSLGWLINIVRKPGFWFILALMFLITLLHYREIQAYPGFLTQIMSDLGLSRHAFERILYLAPMVWAGFLFGWKGALITSVTALACMLPRAVFISLNPLDALMETSLTFVLGIVLSISFVSLRKEREYRSKLEAAHLELKANVQAIQQNEKRLASLNQISSTISQSLELHQVLDNAIDNVIDVMQVDIAWIYLLNEEADELVMSVYRGIPEEVANSLDRLKVGEGFNGRVAQTGEPMLVEDASQNSRLTKEVVRKYGIKSQLIVPLRCRNKVNGTLCVAVYSQRMFQQEEVELLTVIGNQIGVAIENAKLYKSQQEVAEQLRTMQENLRFYLRQVTNAQEEERKRISHELHDETIQALVALSRRLDTIASKNKGLSADISQEVEEIWQKINDIIREVRRLSQDLRPAALDRLGLLPALEWLASQVTEYSGIATKVSVVGKQRRLAEEVELVLFRIIQEALRNVWRHSQANEAGIKVEFEQSKVKITVSDNGKGFNLPEKIEGLTRHGKLGLTGMYERAQLIGGRLTLQSNPGSGTSVSIEMPV